MTADGDETSIRRVPFTPMKTLFARNSEANEVGYAVLSNAEQMTLSDLHS
jgi:hypothetical protein